MRIILDIPMTGVAYLLSIGNLPFLCKETVALVYDVRCTNERDEVLEPYEEYAAA